MRRVTGYAGDRARRPGACLAVLILAGAVGHDSIIRPATAQASAEAIRFAILAQPLDSALAAFGAASGVQLVYDSGLAAGRRSPGVSGTLTPEAALRRLLEGTGLEARFTGGRAATLAPLPAAAGDGALLLDPITVEAGRPVPSTAMIGNLPPAFAGGQVATGARVGLLGNRDVFDTPFNQTAFTEQLIRDQQARTLTDVVLNDPSVRVASNVAGTTDDFLIRGFPVQQADLGIDGLYGLTEGTRTGIEWVERVEILKGASTLLNGVPPRGSIGGSVNLVPKRAPDEPLARLTTSYVSDTQFGSHIDLGRRFGANKEFGVRFNGAYRDGDTSVDDLNQAFGVAVAGLDYRGERLRLSVDGGYSKQDIDGAYFGAGVLAGFAVPDAPDASTNLAQKWHHVDDDFWFVTGRAEIDITENITAYAAYGRSEIDEFFVTPSLSIINAQGDLRVATNSFPSLLEAEAYDVGMRSEFSMGPVEHFVTISAAGIHRNGYSKTTPVNVFFSNIYDPISFPEPETSDLPRGVDHRTNEVNSRSLGIADTVSLLNDRIQFTFGGRLQQLEAENFNGTTGKRTSRYEDHKVTPAVGLIVKPLARLSLYANYIEGLQQGPTAPATASNAGETFPPFVARQYEVGAKYDFGKFGVSADVFQITQQSAFTDPVTNVFDVDGEQRNRGVEFNVWGTPLAGVRLLGGLTLLEAELTDTQGGVDDGNTAVGVPDVQLNLYGEWDMPYFDSLTLTSRVIYTSSQYVNQANTQQIPSWTRLDLGARYTFDVFDREITLLAAMQNVTGSDYWHTAAFGSLKLGAPRTFLVSTSVRF